MDTPFGGGPSSRTAGILSLSINHSDPRWSNTSQLQLFSQSPAGRTAPQVDQACCLQPGLGEGRRLRGSPKRQRGLSRGCPSLALRALSQEPKDEGKEKKGGLFFQVT